VSWELFLEEKFVLASERNKFKAGGTHKAQILSETLIKIADVAKYENNFGQTQQMLSELDPNSTGMLRTADFTRFIDFMNPKWNLTPEQISILTSQLDPDSTNLIPISDFTSRLSKELKPHKTPSTTTPPKKP
jgi:uncharacterized tellurite resistance protein B-like protein